MNNARRKRICKIADALNELKDQIDELHEEEQEAFENIPESLQGTERYEIAEQLRGRRCSRMLLRRTAEALPQLPARGQPECLARQ